MTAGPSVSAKLVNVRGTELLAGDTREQYRQKLARITLDSMVQFVGLLDADGTVLEINHVALDAVGSKLSDVEGKPFWKTFWWQVSKEVNATLKDSIRRAAQGEFVRWDSEIYGRAGGKETIIIDASLVPVMDVHGKVVFITAEGRDITEKKAQEREIERQRAELAKLDELKTAFFANISHEFRTPLTLMLGPIEDAIADGEEPLGPRQRERVAMVQRNGLRLQKLVNALLDFSRVEAGRIQAVYQPTDLAALTQDLASSFRSACEKASLTLTIDTPPLPQPVFVDHEMWEKIVLNLVSNAFKFTLDGDIKVELAQADGQAVLRVSDTGTGIPESETPRIFERFHRVEGARGRTYEGTGIGLALVKELIELHKGTVAVESIFGKGTTFTVRVPLGSAHLPQDRLDATRDQASTAIRADAFVSEALRWLPDGTIAETVEDQGEPSLAPETPAGERPRVLLADDNADMREYLCRLLATRYEVTMAADGEEALTAARRQRPDLILTDVMMPRLDGFGLLAAVRNDPTLRGVPVIVLSARAGDEAKVEGLQSGADDYLIKPFSARELLARVAANIELARTRAENARLLDDEIAERRRAEAALQALNTTLEQRVIDEINERAKAEDQLRQVQKMEAVGQLTGGIAHDFNNMLAVIIGGLSLVQRKLAKGETDVDRFVTGAIDGAERAAALTQRLLVFSRQQPLAPELLDLNKMISSMVELLERTLGEPVSIETVPGAGLWHVRADPGQLENVILNLSVNARDAMPDGGKLAIETSNAVIDDDFARDYAIAPGEYVLVAVTDTGTGMDPDVIAKAFDPFFTTKGVGKGTGLGLSQVYGFVRQSGGHVNIHSELGIGTTVSIYLPRFQGEAGFDLSRTRASALDRGLRTEIVMVVEDEPRVRAVSVEALTELGYGVVEAAGPKEALRLLDQGQEISLLFTDVVMPDMSGRELTERAREKIPNLKVLYTTGYARDAIVHNGIVDPGTNLLTKPFSIDDLAMKVRQILDK
jgi:PAS domain S-box-containing protein